MMGLPADSRRAGRDRHHWGTASLTAALDAVFQAAGVRVIRSAVQAPRMNLIMECWVAAAVESYWIGRWSGTGGIW
jgi:hypothetical protein